MHKGVDDLYRNVLSTTRKDPFRPVVGTILLTHSPPPIKKLSLFLQLGIDEVHRSLPGLKLVLMIAEDDDQIITPFHASLCDFLTNKDRSQHLFIDPTTHTLIPLDSLELITTNLEGDETNSAAIL